MENKVKKKKNLNKTTTKSNLLTLRKGLILPQTNVLIKVFTKIPFVLDSNSKIDGQKNGQTGRWMGRQTDGEEDR